MITKIQGEAPFQVLTNNFSISPSQEGYTLQISADGRNYSNLFSVGANVTRLVTGVAANSYYRLLGNRSDVSINWMKTCVTEGGGEGGNAGELEPVNEFPVGAPAGTVVALASGNTVGVYQYDGTNWVPVAGGDMSNYYTKAETDDAITSATQDFVTEADITAATAPIQTQLDDVERVTATALTELHDAILELSGATEDFATKAYVTAATAGFMTSADTQEMIEEALTGITADSTKLLPVSELPETAETGTVMALAGGSGFGYWQEKGDGYEYIITSPINAETLAEPVYVGSLGWLDGDIVYHNLYLADYYEDEYDGPRMSLYLGEVEEGTTYLDFWLEGVNDGYDYNMGFDQYLEEGEAYTNDEGLGFILSGATEGSNTIGFSIYAELVVDGEPQGEVPVRYFEMPEPTSETGVYQYDGTSWGKVGGDFATEAYVNAAITSATQDFVTADDLTGYTSEQDFQDFQDAISVKEEVIASAITELHNAVEDIDLTNYYTKSEVDSEITAATENMVTTGDIADMVTTGDIQSFVTSGDVATQVSAATQNMVESTSVRTIWKGTQVQYDAILVKDPNTFYIITNS